MKRKLSVNQLQKQLETWKKYQPGIYEDIISSAYARGILTKKGTVSKAKRKSKQIYGFMSEYQSKYGSYTSYSKRYDEAYKQAKSEGYKGSKKKFIQESYNYSRLITDLFENFASEEAYEEYRYCESLDRKTAIERLEKEIAEHRIFPAEQYEEEYESYEPPF